MNFVVDAIARIYIFCILAVVAACFYEAIKHRITKQEKDEFFTEVERCQRDFAQPS